MAFEITGVSDRPENQKISMAIAKDTGQVYIVAREYPNGVTTEYNIVLYTKTKAGTSFTKSILHSYTES